MSASRTLFEAVGYPDVVDRVEIHWLDEYPVMRFIP